MVNWLLAAVPSVVFGAALVYLLWSVLIRPELGRRPDARSDDADTDRSADGGSEPPVGG